jgi:hypothetical protein
MISFIVQSLCCFYIGWKIADIVIDLKGGKQ